MEIDQKIKSNIKKGIGMTLVGVPIIAQGLSNADMPKVEAQSVSSGTAIELCRPLSWKSVRVGYPAHLEGMSPGRDYRLTESIQSGVSVISGGRFTLTTPLGDLGLPYTRDVDLKIVIIEPPKSTDSTPGVGTFDITAAADFNIRYDVLFNGGDVHLDSQSRDKVIAQSIQDAVTYQGAQSVQVASYDTSTQRAKLLQFFSNRTEINAFVAQQQADEAKICATPTPTNTSTPTATGTATATLTATATSTPTKAPTVARLTPNCAFMESYVTGPGQSRAPQLVGGGDYPPGTLHTMVETIVRTEALRTSIIESHRLDYRLAGNVGQWYEVRAENPDEYIVASFPGGVNGTNWIVRLPAMETFQFQDQDPEPWSPLALDVLEAKGIFWASEFKKQQGLPLNKVHRLRFNPDGVINSDPMDAEKISRAVRYRNCVAAPVVLSNFGNGGW